MSRRTGADCIVALEPHPAQALWMNIDRWPTFVEGFARVLSNDTEWPAEGAELVWESIPGGRGRVTERVMASEPGAFVTAVFEERLSGTQAVAFEPDGEGAWVSLRLEYELTRGGPLNAVADALFIRRAVRDALARTLRRYAVEAEEELARRSARNRYPPGPPPTP